VNGAIWRVNGRFTLAWVCHMMPDMMLTFAQPVTSLKGIGPRLAEKFEKLGILTLQDLLFHLPSRYQDRTRMTPLVDLNDGQFASIQADVVDTKISYGAKRTFSIVAQEGAGTITLKFFHFSAAQHAKVVPGVRIQCFGEVHRSAYGLSMIHPEYHCLAEGETVCMGASLTPIYPTTGGLNQGVLRKHIQQALQHMTACPLEHDLIPAGLLNRHASDDLTMLETLQYLHAPPPEASLRQLEAGQHPAQQRLAIEELASHHLSLCLLRQEQRSVCSPAFCGEKILSQQLLKQLPFNLTRAQENVIQTIEQDMANNVPMLRLVQGDVGSGKTIVAAFAAMRAIESNYQVAMMVPTELLAEQHYRNFLAWFEPFGIELSWLTGKQPSQHKAMVRDALQQGQLSLVIGTHALFQASVEFANLGLIIIDEQHRFGVNQRLALKQKGSAQQPHQLIMTATPIPRTLAMTAYANLDVSVIDELPPGRQPIKTAVIANTRRGEVIARMEDVCQQGRQVYWVCSLVEESEVLQCEAAEDTAALLQQALPNVRVALLHGRMSAEMKEATMADFAEGTTQLLVATTVIEVGVDVPNASLMIIENAERFGLAQLHQLRGRVGRGQQESHCLLLYQSPLSHIGKQRLAVMRSTQDGFEIANQDLLIRGPGEMLGTRQTGLMCLKIADLMRDQALIPIAQALANDMLKHYPEQVPALILRWVGSKKHFATV